MAISGTIRIVIGKIPFFEKFCFEELNGGWVWSGVRNKGVDDSMMDDNEGFGYEILSTVLISLVRKGDDEIFKISFDCEWLDYRNEIWSRVSIRYFWAFLPAFLLRFGIFYSKIRFRDNSWINFPFLRHLDHISR